MMNITECNPSSYSCFYYIGTKSPISVYRRKPSGDEQLTDVDQFVTENGSVIAFKKFARFATDMAYLVKYEEMETLIQYQVYENMLELFSGQDLSGGHHYVLFSSREFNPETNSLVLESEERCDVNIFSALPFFEITDGVSPTFSDPSAVNRGNLKHVFIPLSVPGFANIMRFTFENVTNTYVNFPTVSVTSRTLLGSLRLACEWSIVAEEPFNSTEFPALKIKDFVNKIGITESIKESIMASQEPMAVEKFISTPEDSRIPSTENGVLPEEVSSWIKGIIRYRTLNSLVRETGIANEIPEDILLLEKSTIASEVFKLCLEANIEFETMSYEEIRNAVSHIDKTGIGSSAGECVEKLSGI